MCGCRLRCRICISQMLGGMQVPWFIYTQGMHQLLPKSCKRCRYLGLFIRNGCTNFCQKRCRYLGLFVSKGCTKFLMRVPRFIYTQGIHQVLPKSCKRCRYLGLFIRKGCTNFCCTCTCKCHQWWPTTPKFPQTQPYFPESCISFIDSISWVSILCRSEVTQISGKTNFYFSF